MDDSLQNTELLTRYLDGELSRDEKLALEERLRTDGSLQNELANLKIAVQAIKHFGTTENVGAIHQEMMGELNLYKKSKVVSFRKVTRYTMAVAASLLLLFIGIRLFTNSVVSSEKLFDQSFVDFNVSTARGNDNNLSEIERQYQQKNYSAITSGTRTRNLSAKDSLLIGLSYLHTEKTSQAISFFESLRSSENDFRQDAEYYLSLSYLKAKNYSSASTLMRKIANNPSHLYHEQITNELLENMEKLKNK